MNISVKARAKINLSLDITGKRSDGYHSIVTVMQSLALFDECFTEVTEQQDIRLFTNLDYLPTDERNIAYRCAKTFLNDFGIKKGLIIRISKNIPVSAGLGGGSADCAAVLYALRRLFNVTLTNKELIAYGTQFGADVPFCIMRGTALAEGIGEVLTPLRPFLHHFVLLAKPPFCVSTASVFSKLDVGGIKNHPDTDLIVNLINKGEARKIYDKIGNVLEPQVSSKYPVIKDCENIMLSNGALCSQMGGSGATVFGLFRRRIDAEKAKLAVKQELGFSDVILTETYNAFRKALPKPLSYERKINFIRR